MVALLRWRNHRSRFTSTDEQDFSAIPTPVRPSAPLTALVDDLIRLTDDPWRTRRMLVSLLVAIGITLLVGVVGFTHHVEAPPAPERVGVTSIVMERAPRPTPHPIVQRVPVVHPAAAVTAPPAVHVAARAPAAVHHGGGTSAAPIPRPHPLAPPMKTAPAPAAAAGVALAPGTGEGPAAGAGAGTGSAAAGGGEGGTGEGSGGQVDTAEPCGFVEFIPDRPPQIVGNVSYETIRTTVHFPDGHTASDDFPYPWVYNDYMQTDPWSPLNARKANLVVYAQLPPPGADERRYPEIVRYVLDHTNTGGGTVLQPCPD